MKPADTREQWLTRGLEALRPWFKAQAGRAIPRKVKATCGFPSKMALSESKQRIGECWSDKASTGKTFEIFVSPVLDKPIDVLETLAHEAVHATVGLKAKHGGAFKQVATAIGLEGPMTATSAGKVFEEFAKKALKKLGKYPHAKLRASTNGEKKQGTRLLKCECPECGYTARVTAMWLVSAGAPLCPLDEIPMEADAPEGGTQKPVRHRLRAMGAAA